VVSNLLTNAAKYSDPGSPIVVTASRHGERVSLSIRDRGVGIAPELFERVFELFVQEKQAVDRAGGGLGLGLAIVRNIVELHGGTVSAHSEGAGLGTELLVQLPLCAGVASAAAAAAAPEDGHGSLPLARAHRRILIVDDNEDAASLLAQVLERLGHEVMVANDSQLALERAAAFAPEVALLDIGLPGLDGHEVGARLRQQLPALRLIAISGYGDPASRARSLAAGFEAHLVKPIRREELTALLTG
jgi:CheY-like chemotaxis protein